MKKGEKLGGWEANSRCEVAHLYYQNMIQVSG